MQWLCAVWVRCILLERTPVHDDLQTDALSPSQASPGIF